MTNLLARHHLVVVFFKVVEDNDKPFSLLLSFNFFSWVVKNDEEMRGLSSSCACFSCVGFF